MRYTGLLMLAWLMVGCARYEYDIVHPPELARHVGAKADVTFERAPIEYRLRTADNRLVMRLYNTTEAPLTLLGERSFVVDPDGQSHPLPTQTIAPGSFAKLIFPPLRPRIERYGPTFGIGVGTTIGSARRRGYGWSRYDLYDEPRYFTVYDDDALYWDWDGESQIRLTLVYEQGERTFDHEFVIARRKV